MCIAASVRQPEITHASWSDPNLATYDKRRLDLTPQGDPECLTRGCCMLGLYNKSYYTETDIEIRDLDRTSPLTGKR